MNDDVSLRQWLTHYGDWLGASEIIALMVGSVIGFMQSTRGMAILFSHFASSITTLVVFMVGAGYFDYSSVFMSPTAGVIGGALGMVAFRLLINISDKIDSRRSEIAENIVDRIPTVGEHHGDRRPE